MLVLLNLALLLLEKLKIKKIRGLKLGPQICAMSSVLKYI